MAAKEEEEDGWQPLNNNARVVGQLARNAHLSGSVTASPTSTTVSSSDLDTESTGFFFHDESKTLGSPMGASNILEQSKKKSRKARKGESFKEHGFSHCVQKTTVQIMPRVLLPIITTLFLLPTFLLWRGKQLVNVEGTKTLVIAAAALFMELVAGIEPNSLIYEWQCCVINNLKKTQEFDASENGNGVPVLFPYICCGQLS